MQSNAIFLLSLLIFNGVAAAQQQAPRQQEISPAAPTHIETMRNQTDVFDSQRQADHATPALKAQCMQVTGLEPYCGCLQSKLPSTFTFDNYVIVLSRSKKQNGYAKMDKTAKQVYDAIPQVRDTCATMTASK